MRKKVDARCDREVARRAADEWGVLTTAELLDCGLTYPAISRRGRRGRLHQLYRGVWAVGHDTPPLEGQLLAAVKACGPGTVLSHRSTGQLRGYLDPCERRPEVTVVGASVSVVPGITVHRTAALDPRDRARFDGIPVTAPARTISDLAGVLTTTELRHAVRRAQGLRQVNTRQLVEGIARLGPRRGSRKLARVIATGPAPTRSVLESIVLDVLLGAGFEHPDVNKPLIIDGTRVVPDFRWPAERLVVEADGGAWHDTPVARALDAERQALLEADGERVLRVTWNQAVARGGETIARIRAAGAPLATERRLSSPMRKKVDAR